MPRSPYLQLEYEFRRLHALRSAMSLLRWDAAVLMPSGSAKSRGEQLAALEIECHGILTAPKVSRLLERTEAASTQLNNWQQANVRLMRRERERAMAVPISLLSRLAQVSSVAELHWRQAKEKANFALFAPQLEEVLHLCRDRAQLLGQALKIEPYDALLDEFSPGLTTAEIDPMFAVVMHRLPELIAQAIDIQAHRTLPTLNGRFAVNKQRQLATEIMTALQFPFEYGRLDECPHPFTSGIADDIRVTTHFAAQDPFSGLMGILHETGHALYLHGLPAQWRGQPVGNDAGMSMQESQSLLLEFFIGRSRPMLQFLKPLLEKHLGLKEPEWTQDALYHHCTKVTRSKIRIDADELTYPVHIMLRYQLEQALLSGELKVRELPEAWAEGMNSRLGVLPTHDAEGCLQDVHWALGSFAYFPCYTIGTFIAAQLHECMRQELQGLDEQIASGQFTGVLEWLRENIHNAGALLNAYDLVTKVTGRPLSATAWLRYAEAKYLSEE